MNDLALILDIGSSRLPVERQPDGRLQEYPSGGSLKIRAVEIATGNTVAYFPNPNGSDDAANTSFRRSLAGQPPRAFVERCARQVEKVLAARGIAGSRVTHLVNGFPAFIVNNTALQVMNLRYPQNGRWVHWTQVPLGDLWQEAFSGSLPRLAHILVVNDLVCGIGAYLRARQAELQAGDHILLILPGGGCGVAEALCLGEEVLIMGQEQGHNFYVPMQPLAGPPRPERLEEGYCSSTAFERNYRQLTGQDCPWAEVIRRAAAGDPAALRLVDRYVEGLAYLTSHAVNRGVNRIVITGVVTEKINAAFTPQSPNYLEAGIRAHFEHIARLDLVELNRVRFDPFSIHDNTEGGIALIQAQPVAPHKGGLLRVKRQDLAT